MAHTHRLVRAFAGRTYHIVGNLMLLLKLLSLCMLSNFSLFFVLCRFLNVHFSKKQNLLFKKKNSGSLSKYQTTIIKKTVFFTLFSRKRHLTDQDISMMIQVDLIDSDMSLMPMVNTNETTKELCTCYATD